MVGRPEPKGLFSPQVDPPKIRRVVTNMNRYRTLLHPLAAGLSLSTMTGLFFACSSMRAEAPTPNSYRASKDAVGATPAKAGPAEADEAFALDGARGESAVPVQVTETRVLRQPPSPAVRIAPSKQPAPRNSAVSSANKPKSESKPDRKRTGRRAAPVSPPPAWVQQGGSAPGGDFEARESRINDFTETNQDHLSTFAVDVDTAAYSIARRTLRSNRMPTPSLVRIEEMVNYFQYAYTPPQSDRELFTIQADGTASPIHGNRHILRVGIQAKQVSAQARKPINLVFLVDTSGSMSGRDKLELTKKALSFAVDQLDDRDRVAITTYAGGVRLVLPPTSGAQKAKIKSALNRLRSGGGTAMNSGLKLAYQQASGMLSDDSVTRIIVCSDGDANIGRSSPTQILESIKGYVSEGVLLSTIGFGHGNYKDAMMEKLANRGNGNYYYVDSERQAERVFARDLFKMVLDVAQDVKIQVDMNPEAVAAYRLIGYENRDVADRDFRNDAVDAGEIGSGHQVTALYEVILTEAPAKRLATVRVRAKQPRGTVAKEASFDVATDRVTGGFDEAPEDLRFATAVMGGSELLRHSPHSEGWTYAEVIKIISGTRPYEAPDRAEFLSLMKKAAHLSGESPAMANR